MHTFKMMVRKNRLLKALFTLIIVTVVSPILFNLVIKQSHDSAKVSKSLLDVARHNDNYLIPLNTSPDQLAKFLETDRQPPSRPHYHDVRRNTYAANSTNSLTEAQKKYFQTHSNGDGATLSLEDRIAYGFADITNRMRFAESSTTEQRQEINQLMKELRQLWAQFYQQQQQQQLAAPTNAAKNSQFNSTSVNLFPTLTKGFDFNATSSIVTSEQLHLPSILSLMPHIHLTPDDSINPAFRIAPKDGRTVRFVFGIPTVKRTIESYLLPTLQNLVKNLSPSEQAQACFVVFIAETDIEFVQKTANDIIAHFFNEIKSGLVEIISPPASFYPDMNMLKLTLGDSMERVQWRSKQNLDYAYLMMYCQRKGIFYVQLEDDIITKPSYLSKMEAFVTKNTLLKRDWIILDFCSLGFIGKMFKSADLSKLILFFVMFYNDKPVDWLLDNFVDTKLCSFDFSKKKCKKVKEQVWIPSKPSLFQHVGTHSSLKGKIQKLRDRGFGKMELFKAHHDNPEAIVNTSVKEYKYYKLRDAYEGFNYFWGFSPVKGDFLSFKFKTPINIERCLIRSGNSEHPSDIFANIALEVKSHKPGLDWLKRSQRYSFTDDGFAKLDLLIVDGLIDLPIPSDLNPLEEIRINYYDNCIHWIIISEIYFKTTTSAVDVS